MDLELDRDPELSDTLLTNRRKKEAFPIGIHTQSARLDLDLGI